MKIRINRRVQIAPRFQGNSKLVDLIKNIELHPHAFAEKVLKHDASAMVTALLVNGLQIVVKSYTNTRFKSFHRSVGKSRARKSWEGAHTLKSVGLGTVEPIAVIEDRLGFLCLRACFIGTFVKGVNSKDYFTAADTLGAAQKQTAQRIIESIKQFHSLGIVHGDTKHLNIIIHDNHIAWLDMDAITRPRLRFILNRRKRRDWRTLLYNWSENPEVQRMFIQELQKQLGDRYVFSVIKDLIRRRRQKIVQYRKEGIFPTPGDEEIRNLKEAVKELLENRDSTGWNIIRSSLSEIFAVKTKTAQEKEQAGSIFCRVKLYRNPRSVFFTKTRHSRMVINAKLMQSVGLYTPEVVFSDRIKDFDCLVTKGLFGLPFHDFMQQYTRGSISKTQKTVVLASLGQEIGRMHAWGFIHGDLRFVNIAVNMEKDEMRICFLTNENARYYLNPPNKAIIQDLKSLIQNGGTGLDKNDYLEILKGYEESRQRFNPDWGKKQIASLQAYLISS